MASERTQRLELHHLRIMSLPVVPSEALKPLNPGDRLRDALNADRLNALAALAMAGATGAGFQSGPGMLMRSGPQGFSARLRKRPQLRRAAAPFTITGDLRVVPGLVGGKMPRIGGTALNAATPPTLTITGTGTEYVYFKLNFTVTLASGYLSSFVLDGVDVVVDTSATPAEDRDTKYLLFNTITNGTWGASYFNTSIPITLWDNGYEATLLRYGNL